ncbi:DUF3040 domain-containing protein [Geodermatophilus sp. SYSU D00705]
MLSSHEQRIWDDIERCYAAEAEEPVLPGVRSTRRRRLEGRGLDDLPAVLVAGTWSALLLVIFGAMVTALAIGAATAVGWLLWRYWPLLRSEETDPAVRPG